MVLKLCVFLFFVSIRSISSRSFEIVYAIISDFWLQIVDAFERSFFEKFVIKFLNFWKHRRRTVRKRKINRTTIFDKIDFVAISFNELLRIKCSRK